VDRENNKGTDNIMAKKKLDLNKAKIADGAMKAPKSVYEIIGLNDSIFPTQNYEEYQKIINNMNTIDLVDHAYKIGVVASSDRGIIIDRLERKFLQDRSRFSTSVEPESAASGSEEAIRKEAERIISRGR
jgi:hypothetical protein